MFAVCSLSKIQNSQETAPHTHMPNTDKQPQKNKIWITRMFRYGLEPIPLSSHPHYEAGNHSVKEFPTFYRNWRFITMLILLKFYLITLVNVKIKQCPRQMTEWAWGTGGIILTGKSWSIHRKTCHSALCPQQILRGLDLNWTPPLQGQAIN